MTTLPVLHDPAGDTLVADPDSGSLVPLDVASDRALAHAAQKLAEHDRDILNLKRALAHELRQRHGVGKGAAGGYEWTVAESQSWPVGLTLEVLDDLVSAGAITQGDAERCMPSKPRPDARQLKALIGRLTVSDPQAAAHLAAACSVAPPSVKDVRQVAVDAEREAA